MLNEWALSYALWQSAINGKRFLIVAYIKFGKSLFAYFRIINKAYNVELMNGCNGLPLLSVCPTEGLCATAPRRSGHDQTEEKR